MAWKPDYITRAELAAYVRIADTQDDAELDVAITTASRAVDSWCNRQFGLADAPVARTYTAEYDYVQGLWVVPIDDLMTVSGLTVAVDGTAVTAYSLSPVNAAADGRPWTRLVFTDDAEATPLGDAGEVVITAQWGWTSVPGPVKLATRLQASRFMVRRDSPFGVAGSPTNGSELRLLARVDPDVAVSLRGYSRRRKVA
ncbi:MAG: hypothetical protein JXA67_20330 [Micromonosporaceae bacterium]|nr:hypothetical protein [Micromonosporaceae bacterium]